MRALLVRVAVDQAYGKWNGPVDPATNEFVYVAIPDKRELIAGLETPYANVTTALASFMEGRQCKEPIVLPEPLHAGNMHLDPDFTNLTYGDTKDRARELAKFAKDDLVVFYAGLRPCRPCPDRLVYAIIGLYRVDEVVRLDSVPKERWHENAHTRRVDRRPDDIIVRGQVGASGRLKKCIPIGQWRDGAYRVTKALLQAWGGLSCKDGFIQRSAVPPELREPSEFLRWFEKQKPELVAKNNPERIERGTTVVAVATGQTAKQMVAPRKPKGRDVRDADVDEGVIVVMLRRPRKDDPRRDPYFEFGSFGLTGCHRTNLLADTAAKGRRLAFAQGGPSGFRLVMLTPAVDVNVYAGRREAVWSPAERPLRYADAPLLIGGGIADEPMTGIPELHEVLKRVDRSTWEARFASAFRSRKKQVGPKLGAAITRVWDEAVAAAESRAEHYWEALPWCPTVIDEDRHSAHAKLLAKARGDVIPDRPSPRRDRSKRSPGRRC